MHPQFETLITAIRDACRHFYGDRLVALAVFGSVARGTPRHDSDIDLLVVAAPLPDGRVARAEEFEAIERALESSLARAHGAGVTTRLSPVFKTPVELSHGSPLLLDMIEDARVLADEQGTLRTALERLRTRLDQLGARRIWMGNAWMWDLKPDYRPGEVFEL